MQISEVPTHKIKAELEITREHHQYLLDNYLWTKEEAWTIYQSSCYIEELWLELMRREDADEIPNISPLQSEG
jgi:hypothetical protein